MTAEPSRIGLGSRIKANSAALSSSRLGADESLPRVVEMTEILIRFLIGGVVVSAFSVCGDVLRPKSFAGLFGAAPSVALASLALTFTQRPGSYVALEGRSMVFGAIGFLTYAYVAGQLLKRSQSGALVVTVAAMPIWFGISFGCLFMFGGMN